MVDKFGSYLDSDLDVFSIGDALSSQKMAERLFDLGVYVAGFFFTVVPKGQARIRTQMNAAFTTEDLDQALHAFEKAGQDLGIIT